MASTASAMERAVSARSFVGQRTTQSSANLTSFPVWRLALVSSSSRTLKAILQSNGEIGEPCGVPDETSEYDASFDDPGPQPTSQQLQHRPVRDPALDQGHECVLVDLVETAFDVGVEHPMRPCVRTLANDLKCVMS